MQIHSQRHLHSAAGSFQAAPVSVPSADNHHTGAFGVQSDRLWSSEEHKRSPITGSMAKSNCEPYNKSSILLEFFWLQRTQILLVPTLLFYWIPSTLSNIMNYDHCPALQLLLKHYNQWKHLITPLQCIDVHKYMEMNTDIYVWMTLHKGFL